MASIILDRAVGLYTATNPLSATPPGALVLANNVVIRHDGLIEPRPGFINHGSVSGTTPVNFGGSSSSRVVGLHQFYGQVLAIYNNGSDYKLARVFNEGASDAFPGTNYIGPDWDLDTSSVSTNLWPRSFQARDSLFLNVYPATIKLSNYSTLNTSATYAQAGNPRQAGVVQGLYVLGDTGNSGSAVSAYSQVAYRYVLGYTDENGNEIVGAPSDSFTYVNNSATAYDMVVAMQIPNTQYLYTSTSMPKRNGVFKNMFIRLYRTKNSGGVNINPGDDYFLVRELTVTDSLDTTQLNTTGYYDFVPQTQICDIDTSKDLLGVSRDAGVGSEACLFAAGRNGNIVLGIDTAGNAITNGELNVLPWQPFSGVTFYDAWADPYGRFLVCGEDGIMVYKKLAAGGDYPTLGLDRIVSGTTNNLYAVDGGYDGAFAYEAWAVGAGGTVVYNDFGVDTTFVTQVSGTANDLNDVFWIATNNVYAVGAAGTVIQYTGAWASVVTGISNTVTLYGVGASAANNVWVVGTNGTVYSNRSGAWAAETDPSGNGSDFYTVYVRGASEVYVAGEEGKIYYWNGATWATGATYTGFEINAIGAVDSGTDEMVAVGTDGLITIGGTTSWSRVYSPLLSGYVGQVVAIDDMTPDAVLTVPLYTNANQDGILQQNTPPPMGARDIAFWGNRAWYAGGEGKQRVVFKILGTSDTGSAVTGSVDNDNPDWLKIFDSDGTTLLEQVTSGIGSNPTNLFQWFGSNKYINDAHYGRFRVTADAGATSNNILSTSQSLAQAITGCSRAVPSDPSDTSYGFVREGYEGEFVARTITDAESGTIIVIERQTPFSNSFFVTSNDPTAFSPALSSLESTAETYVNRLFYSKLNQPEAVPEINYLDIGSRNKRIQRIIGMGDRLYVFKEDGIFTISGDDFFRVNELDRSVVLAALNSPAILGNKMYALTNQGVVSINESGVAVVSAPIADQIRPFLEMAARGESETYLYAFGVADETNHRYHLAVPDLVTPGQVCTKMFVYNELVRGWTTWSATSDSWSTDGTTASDTASTLGWRAGLYVPTIDPTISGTSVRNNDKLLLSPSNRAYVVAPPAVSSPTDYSAPVFHADDPVLVNVTAQNQSASTITVAAAAGAYGGYEKIGVGDILLFTTDPPTTHSNINKAARVTAKSSGTLTVAVGSSWSWATTGDAYCYKAIDCQIQYNDVMPDKDSKHFSSATYIFKRRGFYSAYSQMGGEWQNFGGGETVTRSELVFSDRVVKASRGTLGVHASSKRVLVPKEVQRGSYLSVGLRVKEAGSYWALAGIGIETEGGSDRNNR